VTNNLADEIKMKMRIKSTGWTLSGAVTGTKYAEASKEIPAIVPRSDSVFVVRYIV
jgi:hypothetical protein